MVNWFHQQWKTYTPWHIILLPFSWLFGIIVFIRKYLYQTAWLKSYKLDIPVIVIGNINVGGTGKTPLVIWLAAQLQSVGYKPGIISRGYGGNAKQAIEVQPDTDPAVAGDEAVLIAARTSCPVFVSSDRVAAARQLQKAYPACDIIISDDGLQHYRMQRTVEIAVCDSAVGFGNRALLPAGPLREPTSRLKSVDAIVTNGAINGAINGEKLKGLHSFKMLLAATDFYNLADSKKRANTNVFADQRAVAVAGIGNPQRFFDQLSGLGMQFEPHAYPDHYVFRAADFQALNADIVLMTEKDAVKCRALAKPNYWVLPVTAIVDDGLMTIILNKLHNKLIQK